MGEHQNHGKQDSDCIQKKAYEIWEKKGCKNGEDLHDWLQAEKSVKSQHQNQNQTQTMKR